MSYATPTRGLAVLFRTSKSAASSSRNATKANLTCIRWCVALFVTHSEAHDSASTGMAVADYARARSVEQHEQASSLADLSDGIQIVTALTLGRHFDDAAEALTDGLDNALFRLELFSEWQALLKPFFVGGWDVTP